MMGCAALHPSYVLRAERRAFPVKMERRLLYTPIFHIDTNVINARGKLASMNQIEKWASDEVILVHMSSVSFAEAQQGGAMLVERKRPFRICLH